MIKCDTKTVSVPKYAQKSVIFLVKINLQVCISTTSAAEGSTMNLVTEPKRNSRGGAGERDASSTNPMMAGEPKDGCPDLPSD